MAKAAAELEAGSETGDRVVVVGVEFERMVHAVGEYLKVVRPDAVRCRLVFAGSELDESSLSVPLVVIERPVSERVLSFVSRVAGWVKGKVIAAEVELEADGGQFRNLMAELVRNGALESGVQGYRIKKS